MQEDRALVSGLVAACGQAIAAHAGHLCDLDRAIGDGDHGTNMRRGAEAVLAAQDELAQLPLPEAIERIGVTLVMNVGGAAGPLYGTLLMEIGRGLSAGADFGEGLSQAVEAVARRGRSRRGEKTLLDVLYPVLDEVIRQGALAEIAARAEAAARLTIPMKAMRGRASFLGDRSIGHMDPGASSCALVTAAICRYLKEQGPQ